MDKMEKLYTKIKAFLDADKELRDMKEELKSADFRLGERQHELQSEVFSTFPVGTVVRIKNLYNNIICYGILEKFVFPTKVRCIHKSRCGKDMVPKTYDLLDKGLYIRPASHIDFEGMVWKNFGTSSHIQYCGKIAHSPDTTNNGETE